MPFLFSVAGYGLTRNWVKQWPGKVYSTPGENITIHCQIHAVETISRCLVQYVMERDGTYPKINELLQFGGRHEIKNETAWSSSLTLNPLKINDTGMFYCTYFCKMNGTFRQHYGSGTQLFVQFEIAKEYVTLHYPLLSTTVTGENVRIFWCIVNFDVSCNGAELGGSMLKIILGAHYNF